MVKKKYTTETFIEKANEIHNNKYDYSKSEYITTETKTTIICPIHGEFRQLPKYHLKGFGCAKCHFDKLRLTETEFKRRGSELFNNFYIYDKVNYINNHTKVIITCPIHGDFYQTPFLHLQGHKCIKCANDDKRLSIDEFILRSKNIHGFKYDYSKTIYEALDVKVCIICPKHGDFYMTPTEHIFLKHGCPKCSESIIETDIRIMLETNNINYIYNKRSTYFPWLNGLSLDFYLPDYNIAIECQGIQHFKPINFSGNMSEDDINKDYILRLNNDTKKKRLCEVHNVKLIYYSNLDIDYPYKVYTNTNDILNIIREI